MKYFDNCKTTEELKEQHRSYVKLLHPDKGGNAREFADMQAEYEAWEEPKKEQEYSGWYGNTNSESARNTYQQYYGQMRNETINNTTGRYTRPDMQFHADVVQLKLQISLLENVNKELKNKLDNLQASYNENFISSKYYYEQFKKYEKESKHYKELWDAEYKARCERDQQLDHIIHQYHLIKSIKTKPWYIKLKELVYDKK